MGAQLAWIDFDAKAHQRSQRILALFREKDTRDELGLGAIRDAFSDLLFPGTSTIQTRLAYMLYIPWMYVDLERKCVSSQRAAASARDYENRLAEVLVANSDESAFGIFGRSSGRALQRLPSAVYWAGLLSWGLRLYPGSQDQYHREFDRIHERRKRQRDSAMELGDDVGGLWESGHHTWHPGLPPPPEGFPENAGFDLTVEQAAFLQERVKHSHPRSLLAHLFFHPRVVHCDYPWEHPDLASFETHHREQLRHAELFSLVMLGASLLYNRLLAEHKDSEDLVEQYREAIDRWAEDLASHASRIGDWADAMPAFWEIFDGLPHLTDAISPQTRSFVEDWTRLAVQHRGRVQDLPDPRKLVRRREEMRKRSQSRFLNPRVLDQWGGASGVDRFRYRWRTVGAYVTDVTRALRR